MVILEQAVDGIDAQGGCGDLIEYGDGGGEENVDTDYITGHQNRILIGTCRVATANKKLPFICRAVAVEANELHLTAQQFLPTSGGQGLVERGPLRQNFGAGIAYATDT